LQNGQRLSDTHSQGSHRRAPELRLLGLLSLLSLLGLRDLQNQRSLEQVDQVDAVSCSPQDDNHRRHHQIEQPKGDKHFPSQGHELIVPDPGERGPQPDEDKHEGQGLQHEPDRPRQHRPPPAAPEQRRQQRAHRDDGDVLADVEHRELEAAVLGLVASDALLRRLPSSEYLLFDDHPPRMMPYTPTEEVARTNRIPTLTSASRNGTRCPNSITSGPNGITAYTKRAVTIEIAGASQYTITST